MSRRGVSATRLRLDHASVHVPDFADAVRRFEEDLGLAVKVSPEAPEGHGRIHLHHAYLEVAAGPDGTPWEVTHFFLRFSDPEGLRKHLDDARLAYRYDVYEGVDGRWDDVELEAAGVPVPILVRRTQPAEVARNWPPPLDRPHRCGASTLAAVHVPVASIEAAVEVYGRLLAVDAPPVISGPGLGERRAVFHSGPSSIVLVERGTRRAVVLGVASLERARTALGSMLLPTDEEEVAWLDPSATSGLAIGLRSRSWHPPQ